MTPVTRRSPPLPGKKRGPNGERLCRMCGGPVPTGRREWCSQGCVDARLIQHGHGARAVLLKRDGGACATCGLDAVRLWTAWRRVRRLLKRMDPGNRYATAGSIYGEVMLFSAGLSPCPLAQL